MLFEILLIILATFIFVGFIIIPTIKMISKKSDPVIEAKLRLDIAKKEAEAVRLNKETDKLYTEMYLEALEEHSELNKEKYEQ